MNDIDSKIGISGNVAIAETITFRMKGSSDQTAQKSRRRILPDANTITSYSFYGSRNERVAIVLKDKETGKVIHEIPSKNVQELHVWLDKMGYKIVDEKV